MNKSTKTRTNMILKLKKKKEEKRRNFLFKCQGHKDPQE
jgi:hypothetical protein